MARKRRAKDYEDNQTIRYTPNQKADRPRLTAAKAKDDLQQAGRQEGSPGILVLAVLAVTLFIGFYYHILALQGLQQLTGGMSMLDHHVSGFTLTDVEHLADFSAGGGFRNGSFVEAFEIHSDRALLGGGIVLTLTGHGGSPCSGKTLSPSNPVRLNPGAEGSVQKPNFRLPDV
ncbi:MAG: hypothetical protein L0G71_03830, partial [Yaniella sp.]|nr:hypothetical protein [Yaniella sp.]